MSNTLDVTVTIASTLYDLTPQKDAPQEDAIFIGGEEEEGEFDVLITDKSDEEEPSGEQDTIRFSGNGTLTDHGDRLELAYDESKLIGMDGCVTRLIFFPAAHKVTMVRSGGASATMVFSTEEPRQHCLYETGIPGFPLELCVYTRRLIDGMTPQGGSLDLDYIVEMRGIQTERTVFHMDVTPLPPCKQVPIEHEN